MNGNHLKPNDLIHRYRVLKVLGVGGFGIVYLVEHVSLGYKVVVKEYFPSELAFRADNQVVAKDASGEIYQSSLTRFVRECEILLSLNHKHIVYVYDCFFANGTAYMVMQYEHGESMEDYFTKYLKRNNSPKAWPQLYEFLPGIFSALKYMHDRSVYHRDIKPANIFLRSGTELFPLLIDFGAVKIGSGTTSRLAPRTPCYAALEQDNFNSSVGPWTDIHALGVTILQLLSGFRVQDNAVERLELIRQQKMDSINTTLQKIENRQLRQALQSATALHHKDRFQSIAQFAEALNMTIP